jgi:hypothetical protein
MNERAIKSCLQTSRERERESGKTVLTYAIRKGQLRGARAFTLDGLEVEKENLSFLLI